MEVLIIAILVTFLMVGWAVYRERRDKRIKNAEDNQTSYQKHLINGGKDYRKINKK